MPIDKSWIDWGTRCSLPYFAKLDEFLDFAYANKDVGSSIYCPCRKCKNRALFSRKVVRKHLRENGFWKSYKMWTRHGERIDQFEELVQKNEVRPESHVYKDVEMARSVDRVIGLNSDGYFQTNGSSTPHSLVYPLYPSAPNSTSDLIKKITEEVIEKETKEVNEKVTKEVTERVAQELTGKVTKEEIEKVTKEMIEELTASASETIKQFAMKFAPLKARFMLLKSTYETSTDSQVQIAASVDQRESVGDRDHILTSNEERVATKDGAGKGNDYECSEIAGAAQPALKKTKFRPKKKKTKFSDEEEVSSVLREY